MWTFHNLANTMQIGICMISNMKRKWDTNLTLNFNIKYHGQFLFLNGYLIFSVFFADYKGRNCEIFAAVFWPPSLMHL